MGGYYSKESPKEYNVSTNNSDKKNNESHIYRHPSSLGADLSTLNGDMKTIHDVYKKAKNHFSNEAFLGTRQGPNGELFKEFRFKTYGQIFKLAEEFGSALYKHTKVNDQENNYRFVAFHSKNNMNFSISDIACCLYKLTILPVYDTLGPEANHFIFDSTNVEIVLIETSKLKDYLNARRD